MEKQILINYIMSDISANKIAKMTGKSLSTIKYWLKKHNLKTNHVNFKNKKPVNISNSVDHYCPKCQTVKLTKEFYVRKDRPGFSSYCKICANRQAVDRCRLFKEKCLKYKGNSCSRCGYNKYIGALEFHHLDPTQKDFSISQVKKWRFDDKIKKELDKCIVLCSNCHKEVHFELRIN